MTGETGGRSPRFGLVVETAAKPADTGKDRVHVHDRRVQALFQSADGDAGHPGEHVHLARLRHTGALHDLERRAGGTRDHCGHGDTVGVQRRQPGKLGPERGVAVIAVAVNAEHRVPPVRRGHTKHGVLAVLDDLRLAVPHAPAG